MLHNKKILSITPARGGSQGIPLKNLAKINDQTLIQITGEFLASCEFIDKLVLSSDHQGIIDEAKNYHFEVPFTRPANISGHMASDLEVLTHAINFFEKECNEHFDIILLMQVTTPIRQKQNILDCINLLIKENLDSVWTVSEVDSKSHPLKQLAIDSNQNLSYFSPEGEHIVSRHQLTPTYKHNGVCYAFSRDCLMEKKKILTNNSKAVIVNYFSESIDTPEELDITRLKANGKF